MTAASVFKPQECFCVSQMEQVLETTLWEALWPSLTVPEILQMRTAAQAWNDSTRRGLYCEMFFFLMKNEPADVEAFMGTLIGLCDYIWTVEAREAFVGTPPGLCENSRTLETRSIGLRAATRKLCLRGTEKKAGMAGCRRAHRSRGAGFDPFCRFLFLRSVQYEGCQPWCRIRCHGMSSELTRRVCFSRQDRAV